MPLEEEERLLQNYFRRKNACKTGYSSKSDSGYNLKDKESIITAQGNVT
jgi:hypothetical protein